MLVTKMKPTSFQVYPTSVRSVGLGTASSMARLGAMLSPFVAQVISDKMQLQENIFVNYVKSYAILVYFVNERKYFCSNSSFLCEICYFCHVLISLL